MARVMWGAHVVRSRGVTGSRRGIISVDEAAKVTNTDQFFYFILECFVVFMSVAMVVVVAAIFSHISIRGSGCLAWWWNEVSLQGLIKETRSSYSKGAYLVKWDGGAHVGGCQGGGLWGGVGGGGGCIVIAEFGVEGLHFLQANIIGRTQLELVHRGRWVEVDIVSEGVGL